MLLITEVAGPGAPILHPAVILHAWLAVVHVVGTRGIRRPVPAIAEAARVGTPSLHPVVVSHARLAVIQICVAVAAVPIAARSVAQSTCLRTVLRHPSVPIIVVIG
jgi:hypothetical protein